MRTRWALADVDLGHTGHEVLGAVLGCTVANGHVQRCFGLGQFGRAGVGQQPVVADALEPGGQDALHVAGNEVLRLHAHSALLALLTRFAQGEGADDELIALERQDALVANGRAVGVSAQVSKHLRGPAASYTEWGFGIDQFVGSLPRPEIFPIGNLA